MYIRVRVLADAKRESLEQISSDLFFVSVKEPAEQNLANRRVLEIIAGHFKVLPKQIRIVSGHHSHGKILSIQEQA